MISDQRDLMSLSRFMNALPVKARMSEQGERRARTRQIKEPRGSFSDVRSLRTSEKEPDGPFRSGTSSPAYERSLRTVVSSLPRVALLPMDEMVWSGGTNVEGSTGRTGQR